MNARNDLIQVACDTAIRGALEYLHAHHLEAEPSALADCCLSWVNIKFPEAMADAREAIECGMAKMAEATFRSSMVLAGIEAAKEAGLPKHLHISR